MFRDLKSGGYQINKTYLHGDRLISLIVLITIIYSSAFLTGEAIEKKHKVKYVSRVKEKNSQIRRHSHFYISLHGKDWI